MSGRTIYGRKLAYFCAAGALSLAFCDMASATTILEGNTSASTFSDVSGFVSSTSTELTWGTQGGSGNTGGTLTIGTPLTFSAGGTTITPLQLAELVMTVQNNPDIGTNSFNYNVVLDITTPALGANTYVFPLSVSASSNGSNSTNTVMNLVFASSVPGFPTSIDLGNGFALTNFVFDAVNVSADSTGFSSGDWSVTGHSQGPDAPAVADLFLTADVVLSSDNSSIASVPEPASLPLFGGAMGIGWLLLRRRRAII